MRKLLVFIAVFGGLATSAMSQDLVPDRRLILNRNVDFYGSDLQSIFDTTLEQCESACLSQSACSAMTFNTRNASCFLKREVSDRVAYDGAFSGEVVETDPAILETAETRADELRGFLRAADFDAAKRRAEGLTNEFVAGGWDRDNLADLALEAERSANFIGAMRYWGAATVVGDNGGDWSEYGRLALAAGNVTDDRSEKRNLMAVALEASIAGYLRLENPGQRANTLLTMAQALENLGRGRETVPALRLANEIAPRDDIAEALDRAIGMFGFRVTETEVTSDNVQPAICATFSEPLIQTGHDYADFVQSDTSGLAVEASGDQLCIKGVEHGGRYSITLRSGLPSGSGEELAQPVQITQYVRDRSPAVHFPGQAYVLPATENAGLPIVAVNTDEVALSLLRISDRNLIRTLQENVLGRNFDQWQARYLTDQMAEEVWTGKGVVASELNRDVTTRLPIGEAIADQPPGIYALQASVPGADPYASPPAVQWFVISDIGLSSLWGADGVHVFARSLASAEPMAGAEVDLLNTANDVLATLTTDDMGYAHFGASLAAGQGSSAPAMLVVRQGEDDMVYLSLKGPEFDLSDRGVEGHPAAPPIDLFVTTDRGAYRAGETIYATALARDGEAEAIENLPITAILTRPDGVEYTRDLSTGSVAGGHVFDLPVGGNAPRGTWRIDFHADPEAPALASTTLLVEDFLPERIDFDLTLPEGPLSLDSAPQMSVDARYLFGAPGADLPYEGDIRLTPVTQIESLPGYRFGLWQDTPRPQFGSIVSGRTDGEGLAQVPLSFPEIESAGRPLLADVTLRVKEGSGRPVERSISRAVSAGGMMIGIKPAFDGELPENSEAVFDLVALAEDMAEVPMEVSWTLNRVTTRYQWYSRDGYWDWEPITTRSRVDGGALSLDGPTRVSAPVEWGRYELVVNREGGAHLASSVDFYAGWYVPADVSETPDMLEVSLDAQEYAVGDTARLRIVPREPGKAMVTVMSNRLIDMVPVEVEGETIVDLPVTEEWGAGVYVAATLVRPLDEAQGRNPTRALGLAHAGVDPGAHQLSASIDAPEMAKPRGTVEVSVVVDGLAEGDTAYVTLAAIDQGILNLTGFTDPDPSDHYFGQRRLGMGIRDVYGKLIDGMTGDMGQIRSGGDASAQMRMEAPPPTEELMAQFFGPIEVQNGRATATIDLPDFNGSVRLMAVAWSETGIGQAGADMLVRDPVVLSASVPRFLAPGDRARMLLELTHASGPTGEVEVTATSAGLQIGGGVLAESVRLSDGATERLSVPIQADTEGTYRISVVVTPPDGERLTKTLTIPVQSLDPDVARTSRFQLAAGDRFTFTRDVFDDLRPGSARATLAAGPLARIDAPGLLERLDRYPYGCTEQTTSRALPLLYMGAVAEAMGLADRDDLPARITDAIENVLANQSASGSFGLWRAGSGDLWLDAFVSDFLSRARAQGYAVPDTAFRTAMDNLRNRVNYYPEFDEGGRDLAYALYVLAREGAAAMGDLRYYADVKGEAFDTPLATAQIGAALAAYGDPTRADRMFSQASRQLATATPEGQVWRADYGTNLRDTAAVLTLAVEAGSDVVDRDALTTRIAQADRHWSTQEATWSLLAANALLTDAANAALTINGEAMGGPLVEVMNPVTLASPWLVENTGSAPVDLTLTTFGVPLTPEPPTSNGYTIERQYFSMEGEPVRVDQVAQGERFVTLVTVTPLGGSDGRLMIADPLPAGFEIDNPNLIRGGDIRALDWLDLTATTESTEFRQDRFLAAVNWQADTPIRLAYIVRAVTPGEFHHPAVSVEDMYRPEYRATGSAGRVVIE
ncbi:alpha-2-macroglobulin family protein [Maritimibacter dapengensis]|uniref:Alpha-2-macroglobulin family protein n=1 Tax=Maritimibacter dapengensis TaxID=2836868 RepID=A0ABS6T556_9RHOB|nr:alpha-2-macroglobulin family protein [Maritimibacter dapengensis]MBV7380367.1 alpha-2-macroglobulin family protein [Maritimibacter dapengensis]